MISPADQWCIEIDITNACGRGCANCTRFTNLIRQPFFMPVNVFRMAVRSLDGYAGAVGVMGGEPTLHPDFGEIARVFRDTWHPEAHAVEGREAIQDFEQFIAGRSTGRHKPGRRVLFTSLGGGYRRNFETIQDTFHQQGVNTHAGSSLHQALLVTRKELNIPDADWFPRRDACWVQRNWSASITPKGAYFCEIAGALDMLYDSLSSAQRKAVGMPPSGGWPVERGWWLRHPEEFGQQLGWCEFCGAALGTPCVEAASGGQKTSALHASLLGQTGARSEVIQVLTPDACRMPGPPASDPDWYLRDKRLRASGHGLHPGKIEGIVVSVDCAEELKSTLPGRASQLDHCIIVTTSHDVATQRVARSVGATVVTSDACYDDHASFNKAALINEGLRALKYNDWVVFSDADIFFDPGWREQVNRLVLNPGCLYYTRRRYLQEGASKLDLSLLTRDHLWDPCGSDGPWGYFQLWNQQAKAWQDSPKRFPLCFPTAGTLDHWFKLVWPDAKIIRLPNRPALDVYHIWHGTFASRWGGRFASDPCRWQYAGQSDIHSEMILQGRLDPPCWVRRVEVFSGIEETRYYTGEPIQWALPTKPKVLYAFSQRKEMSRESAVQDRNAVRLGVLVPRRRGSVPHQPKGV